MHGVISVCTLCSRCPWNTSHTWETRVLPRTYLLLGKCQSRASYHWNQLCSWLSSFQSTSSSCTERIALLTGNFVLSCCHSQTPSFLNNLKCVSHIWKPRGDFATTGTTHVVCVTPRKAPRPDISD